MCNMTNDSTRSICIYEFLTIASHCFSCIHIWHVCINPVAMCECAAARHMMSYGKCDAQYTQTDMKSVAILLTSAKDIVDEEITYTIGVFNSGSPLFSFVFFFLFFFNIHFNLLYGRPFVKVSENKIIKSIWIESNVKGEENRQFQTKWDKMAAFCVDH